MKPCFDLEDVDLIFGPHPDRGFKLLDQGKNRDQIQKESQQVLAVSQVSLKIDRGETLVIMGLSGSGKSSMIRCLNGMHGRGNGALRGQVRYLSLDGKVTDVARCKGSELRELRRFQISMVFQQFGLMPWRTVAQNVAFPLEIQGLSKKQWEPLVVEKLKLVGLEQWKNHYPLQLSGGMQQRVGLARAFVTDASVLLMDEPFSALDPLHKRHLQDEVVQLQKKLKKTIVFVTHDLSEAMRIGTRIVLMDAGRILQVDTPERILAAPACERVKAFTSQI